MTLYSRGVAKTVAIAPESSFGIASAQAGQFLRRTRSDLSPSVQQVESQEILPSQQVRDSRQGARQIQGTIAGQLSPATYSLLLQGLLRNTYAAASPVGPLSDTSATIDGNGNLVIVSPSASWSTKFKIGDMVRITGLTGSVGSADNLNNARVVAISPGANSISLSCVSTPVAWTGGTQSAVTVAMPGKRLIVPATGQIDQSFTLEHAFTDIGYYELFTGCKVTQVSLQVPASGFIQFSASVIGQQIATPGVQTYATAAAPTTTTALTANTGKVMYNGVPILYMTGAAIQIISSTGADNVVGSNLIPQISLGTLSVRGSFTALTTVDTLTSDFLNEVETSISLLMTTSPAANADYVAIHLPRVKLTAQSKNDSDKAITRSFNFTALENTGSVVYGDLSTILVEDSLTS